LSHDTIKWFSRTAALLGKWHSEINIFKKHEGKGGICLQGWLLQLRQRMDAHGRATHDDTRNPAVRTFATRA
jgi:hypothetical protein